MTEIVSKIKTKSELDCKARDIVTIEEGDMDYSAALDKFAKILSGDPGSNPIRGWLIFLSIFVFSKLICGNNAIIYCHQYIVLWLCIIGSHKAFLLVCILFSSPVFIPYCVYSCKPLAMLTPVMFQLVFITVQYGRYLVKGHQINLIVFKHYHNNSVAVGTLIVLIVIFNRQPHLVKLSLNFEFSFFRCSINGKR